MFRSKTTSFANKIAHTSTIPALGNKDLRLLQDVIINEKGILTTMQKLAIEFSKASESLKSWGLGEGEDLGDIMSHSASIFGYLSAALNNYANHEHSVRAHLKTIRTREEKLEELKRKRKNVASKADAAEKKLSKMSGENKNLPTQTLLLNQLRDEIRQLDTEITIEETKLGDFKRLCSRNFMALKFGGLLELGEKATIIGELGKLLIDEIPLDPTSPGQPRAFFQSHSKTTAIVDEVSRCMAKVVFNPGPEVTTNPDAYAPRNSDVEPSRVSDEPAPYSNPYGSSQYYAPTNYADTTSNTMSSNYAALPSNELGELSSSSQRQYGSQTAPAPTSDFASVTTGGRAGGADRFATFPVKSRQPPPIISMPSEIGPSDNFGTNVAMALRFAEGGESGATSTTTSTTTASSPSTQVNRKAIPYTTEESQLPYTQYGNQNNDQSSQDITVGVRFRTPSIEVSGGPPIAPGVDSPIYSRGLKQQQQQQQQPSAWSGGTPRRSRRKLSDGGQESTENLDVPQEVGGEEDEEHDGGGGHGGHSGGDGGDGGGEVMGNPAYDHEVFTTDQDDHYEDDEHERNAAAAREIAREMDTLGFPMPPAFTSLPQQQQQQQQQEAPPILPPISTKVEQPQFQQEREASYPSPSQTNTPSYQYQQQPSIVRQTPSPLNPPGQAQSNASPIAAPSGYPYSSQHVEALPQIPSTTSISRTDYYSAASASNISIPSPQTTSSIGGPRTISAAAFKRAAKDGDANKRRFLPSSPSPRPSIDHGLVATAPAAESAATSPSTHRPPALIPGGRPVPSSELNEPSSPSSLVDYGALGHVRIANETQSPPPYA